MSSEKISIDLDVMTGSMDFREAFGLRPADVKAFIHSACQADTVDTSDAGGAGKCFQSCQGFRAYGVHAHHIHYEKFSTK